VSVLPILRRFVPLLVICSLTLPTPALAWDAPVGSPPGWRSYWVQTADVADVFVHADGDATFGAAPAGLFFRVDAPEQHRRLWVYDPLVGTWAWLPAASTHPASEPTMEDIAASVRTLDPREYLYQQAPDIAPRMDCIINGESGWDPAQQNRRTRAAGLAQFLPSTWATTPEGQRGLSPFDPLSNIDAAIWLARTTGWTQWQVYTEGLCR
jgi:transglycosylase-like protein with SLT domain